MRQPGLILPEQGRILRARQAREAGDSGRDPEQICLDLIKFAATGIWPTDQPIVLAGKFRLRCAVEPLVSVLRNAPEYSIVWQAAVALASIGSRCATRPLLGVLRTATSDVAKQAAAYVLRYLADARATTTLCRIVARREEAASVRAEAAEALGSAPRRRAQTVEVILNAAMDESPEVRLFAANCLGVWRLTQAIPTLTSLLDDDTVVGSYGSVSDEARAALSSIAERNRRP